MHRDVGSAYRVAGCRGSIAAVRSLPLLHEKNRTAAERTVYSTKGVQRDNTPDHYRSFIPQPHVPPTPMTHPSPLEFDRSASHLDSTEDRMVTLPCGIQGRGHLFATRRERVPLPDFGENWEALSECPRDLSWLTERRVALVHDELPTSSPDRSRCIWRSGATACAIGSPATSTSCSSSSQPTRGRQSTRCTSPEEKRRPRLRSGARPLAGLRQRPPDRRGRDQRSMDL